jgi:endonuclease/exonuclease/phosphatase family metal-dependent hydrolase
VITVATWNVLHRVHAENWVEDVTRRWPDESARIAAITARLAARTERVIALQEVSGDQLASLRRAMPGRTVHAFRYPRVPKPRRGSHQLRDLDEYLVLLVDGPSREVAAESFPTDKGKGALAVQIAGTLVIATHVSGDQRRTRQLARLAELAATAQRNPVVLLGDFNADSATVTSGLGSGFAVADLPPDAQPTRPSAAGQWIDHVVVRGAAACDATVEAVDGLSDHNLVRANIGVP